MLEGKRIIGLCTAKVHEKSRSDFVDKLNRAVVAAGYKMICFNSPTDFYPDNKNNEGAKQVFQNIDFGVLDALILCPHFFADPTVTDEIADRAIAENIPVILVNGDREDCFCVRDVSAESFRQLLRHVILEHGIRDTFFLAGIDNPVEDPDSALRLQCYRDVLKEAGIPFDRERIAYGEYWEVPTNRILEELWSEDRIPRAFLCANDYMAFAVCKFLEEHGKRVPEDIVVTGFDGVPAVEYFRPKLSTCREDAEGVSKTCMEILSAVFAGGECKREHEVPYGVLLQESCGCKAEDEGGTGGEERLYRRILRMEDYQDRLATELDNMMNSEGIEELYKVVSHVLDPNMLLCLNSRFLRLVSQKTAEGRTAVVPSCNAKDTTVGYINDTDMIPKLSEEWFADDTFLLVSAVYSKDFGVGCLIGRTNSLMLDGYRVKAVAQFIGFGLNALINKYVQVNMLREIRNSSYLDSVTGLPNLRGASRWFERFDADPQNHRKTLAFSIYALPKYTYIFENFGLNAVEECCCTVAELLGRSIGENGFLAKISDSEFLVINFTEDPEGIGEIINHTTGTFYLALAEYNRVNEKSYYLEVNAGCTSADVGWGEKLEVYINCASNELLLNRLKRGEIESVDKAISYKEYYSVFRLLIENNLFTYYMQPIVDAHTGEIFGYEALMRTTGGIELSPIDVLNIAKEYKQLEDIEHATFFNVIGRYAQEPETFHGRRVFINTIPNHFLSERECEELREKYGEILSVFVFELTEQETCSDEEVIAIKRFCDVENETNIAIDDFGTGHSNIVNLLRYSPGIIKIDRYLISGINTDVNKQMFVKNAIEFASMNGIKVLAEGVETSEELTTVISYGVDLIQGYYTGRPAPDPIEEIDDKVRNEIINENLEMIRYTRDKQKIYNAADGETLNLVSLALMKYTYIHISSGRVVLVGKKDSPMSIGVRVTDNADVHITMRDLNLNATDEPGIQLGMGSKVVIELEGFNSLNKNGLLVSKQAEVVFKGQGSLLVNSNQPDGVGIGAGYQQEYGKIVFAQQGSISVMCSGDRLVGVGGRFSTSSIEIKSGKLEVVASGISVVAIGSAKGEADISISDAMVKLKVSGNEAVGIGNLSGDGSICLGGDVSVVIDAEKAVGLGVLKEANCRIRAQEGSFRCVIHCDVGCSLGSLYGNAYMDLEGAAIYTDGEGANVVGIGSLYAHCVTEIRSGLIVNKVVSGNPHPFGNPGDRLIITGGNIIQRGDPGDFTAWNAYGQRLHCEMKEEKRFDKVIDAGAGEYRYSAERSEEYDELCVYLP